MAAIVIDQSILVALLGIVAISVMGAGFLYTDIKRFAPEAFKLRAARKGKKPLVMVHYQSGRSEFEVPEEENMEGSVLPFYKVKRVGLKFRDTSGQKSEMFGGITLYHHFEVTPEPINTKTAVAFSQMNDWLKSKNMDIDGIEDLVYLAMSDTERVKDIKAVIRSLHIETEEERMKVEGILRLIDQHRKEVEQMRVRSGIFTYMVVTRALDATLAYTSANLAFSKSAIETWVKAANPLLQGDAMKWGIIFVMVMVGLLVFVKGANIL